mmetsp:Transcript_8368/g.17285  ORF Transcript_8368/g.17285 Transcript_8368/m.17285 type:complete len:231 (+) Transcript_8368:362-1054(+)
MLRFTYSLITSGTGRRPSELKMEAFHCAPRAHMEDAAPVSSRIRWKSAWRKMSPLAMTGTDMAATTSLMRFQCAGSRGRCGTYRPWRPIAVTPHDSMIRTSSTVSSTFSRSLILQVSGFVVGRFLRSVVRMSRTVSGCFNSLAPMPPDVEKCFGHPIFMSIAATSPQTISAAFSAVTASPVPIWNTERPYSSGQVRYTSLSFLSRKSTVFSMLFSKRRQCITRLSTSSSP